MIKSLVINQNHVLINEDATLITVNFCVENIEVKERESKVYKRVYHATKKYLEENIASSKIQELDLTPFINMSDDDFNIIKKSKLIESSLIKKIDKVRKSKID